MANVVLEDIYKSFPARNRKQKTAEPSATVENTPQGDDAQATNVLRRINLTVADSEFMVLVGPSGCGKSTLLRLIAGLEDVTAGNIWVGDRKINALPPKDRDIAMVFQSYALYPHMSVYKNLAFGLRRTRFKRTKNVDRKVREVAESLQIEALLDRKPKQLSGGQKQRVALGRAMARDPQVFLMDEPLSNLDAKLRAQTRAQIVKLQRQLQTTTIYVTHDQTEAMTMGDRIAVMDGGVIQQIAPPLELYRSPANRFVAGFIGSPPMNFLPVQVSGPLLLQHPLFQLTLPEVWGKVLQPYQNQSLTLGIRPEHLNIVPNAGGIPLQVELVEALGAETYLSCVLEGDVQKNEALFQARIAPDQQVQAGDTLFLAPQLDNIHLFDSDSGVALALQ
ncbi:Trehalose import ATP-binding protein SugC [Acaryochloris thomasi RCC1774]|uniref:Trehalose import ATP-binding protein SugC n=1 Tax=Acaryochloris thomasi RCC1774 TaxID=1764569 RepID=A0A2W1JYR4_9CYAN|nr:sn-glycerol-3-phosphate ABC transporter ATP-binding protein UgpC [Acaryochloris thomasi]PZD75112.1 Trehalose import ATP-binding protein SugC [Acaryochloris thomasi RCC1774]